jgi:hypothetical protein
MLCTLAGVYAGQALCSCEISYPHISLFDATVQKTTIQILRPVETSNIGSEFFYEDTEQVVNASERTVCTARVIFIVILVEGEYCVFEENDSVWLLFLLWWTIDRQLIS